MWFTPQLFLSLFVWRCVIFPRTKVQCKHSVTMIFIDWHCHWIVGTRTGRKLKAYMSTEGNNPKVSGTDGFESIECAIWPTVHHKATMHDTKIERSGQWTHPIFRNHRCCSVLRKKKEYEAGHNPTRYTRHTQAQSPIDYSLQHMLLLVLNFSRFFVVVNSPFSNKFKFMFFFHAKQRQWKELRTKERAMRKRCRKRFLWQLRRIRVNKKGKVTKKKRAKGKRPSSRTDHISWQRWPLALSLCCTQASPSTRRRNIICYMLGMCVSLRACSWHTQQFVLSTK